MGATEGLGGGTRRVLSAVNTGSQWSTRSSMILELQAPSAHRWSSFVLVYSPLLRFWIDRKQVPAAAQDDILQECLKSIFLGIGEFRRHKFESGSFRGWLRTIVNRRVADYFRVYANDKIAPPELVLAVETPEQRDPVELVAEEVALKELEARALHLIRESTAERTWQMFWLSTIEQVPTSEIAEQFGVTSAGVRVAKARVIERLRRMFVDSASQFEK
jgi:RNA polymerase sigma-70 factor, ECF subfamily